MERILFCMKLYYVVNEKGEFLSEVRFGGKNEL